MKYLALDVETANADYSSICQIGIARFEGGEVVERWESLVNPEGYFDPFNISIHGIEPEDVKGAPTFRELYEEIRQRIEGQIVVHHMPFDKTALHRTCGLVDMEPFVAQWVDSARVVRRVWTQFKASGYGLANVAGFLGIEFAHHDALADAIAAGLVFARACEEKGLAPADWPAELSRSTYAYASEINREGDPAGSLYGETVVFTGTLQVPRKEAAAAAAAAGCKVSNGVTKGTTLLVVGLQDEARLAGYGKSSKHRKAEQLIGQGTPIQIISEADFWGMVGGGG